MKKLITALFLLLGITVFAQGQGDKRAELSDEEMAARGARNLAMQLDLNAEQEEEIKALFAERIEYRRSLKAQKDKNKDKIEEDRKEMRKELIEMNEEQRANLQEILTEEQYSKWESLQEKRKRGRKVPDGKREN